VGSFIKWLKSNGKFRRWLFPLVLFPWLVLPVFYFHIFYAFFIHYLSIFYACRPCICIYISFCVILLLLLLRFISLDLHFWARTKVHTNPHTHSQNKTKNPKKVTLSNPREKVATWLTNCSVQFRSSFPLGQEVNTAISAKQSEYKCGAVVDKAGRKGGSRQAKGNM